MGRMNVSWEDEEGLVNFLLDGGDPIPPRKKEMREPCPHSETLNMFLKQKKILLDLVQLYGIRYHADAVICPDCLAYTMSHRLRITLLYSFQITKNTFVSSVQGGKN